MSDEKKDDKVPKKPVSGWDSKPNTDYITKSKDGIKDLEKALKSRKNK